MQELDKWHDARRWDTNEHVKRAVTLKGEGQTSAAVTELLHARSRFPWSEGDAAFARTLTGMALILEGRAEEAIAELQEAIRLYPYLAAPHVAMAYALLVEDEFDGAIEAYRQAIRIDPYDRDLYLPLLRAFEQTGRIDDLFADYREVLPPLEEMPLCGPNPVELFLANQPSAARRNSCLQVLCEQGVYYPWVVARARTGRRATTTSIRRYRSWRQAGC